MRDDFSNGDKQLLSKRTGSRCSNPECRCSTSGPSNTPGKAINLGVAAHIAAASPGGQRYDASMSPEERGSVDNGIWLCQQCAKMVDDDPSRFTIETLHQWREDAECFARQQLERPSSAEPANSPINAAVHISGSGAISISGPNAVHLGPNAIQIVQNVTGPKANRKDERNVSSRREGK